jgi:excisionase family DNA binding protein
LDAWLAATGAGATLATYAVATDDAYLAKRESLPPEIRKTLDIARYEALRDILPGDDPFRLASAVPLEFAGLLLNQLVLSTRCRNVLERQGISTVGDLAGSRLEDCLRDWKNFGRSSAAELTSKVRNAVDRVLAPPSTDPSTLLLLLDEEMSGLSGRNRDIVKARLGFDGRIHTLEEIGGRYHVTRQRIEQISNRWFQSVHARRWLQDLLERVERLFQNRREPLYLVDVGASRAIPKEVAQPLKVAEKTVYAMARTKELPAFRVRGQWRFRRDDITGGSDEQTDQKLLNAGDRNA